MQASDEAIRQTIAALNAAAGRLFGQLLSAGKGGAGLDPAAVLAAINAAIQQDPARWQAMQERHARAQTALWQRLAQGETTPPPPQPDRRFRAPEWYTLPYFDYLRASYLLNAGWLNEMTAALPLSGRERQRMDFFTRQLIDAACPANFAATNPEVIKLAAESNGESLCRGLEILGDDLRKNRITQCDEAAFAVGRNIAVTPGEVVFENELMQLIQYRPQTARVHARPLVMVPPCINKYYILDLQPENSFVRFAVDNGHTVFMVSWRNVPEALGHLTWDDYLQNGVMTAIEVARDICEVKQVNTLGFCIGGTLLAAALAVLHARGERPAASVTLLTSMLDFQDTGELSVFVDEDYVRGREAQYAGGGVMRGAELALTFSSLRANDLIWPYVINGYLKGRRPEAFDLLFWNSDSTNLPGAMYGYYVRNTYLENNLCVPGRLTMCGVPVDLGRLNIPAYLMAAHEDHIVPWRTAWQNNRLLKGKNTFVLAASGHIAGVINPAAKNRRHYWSGADGAASADDWLNAAHRAAGSWWTHWARWLGRRGGGRIVAPVTPGSRLHRALEPAPGRYVKQRCD